jgi:hypothetical protein
MAQRPLAHGIPVSGSVSGEDGGIVTNGKIVLHRWGERAGKSRSPVRSQWVAPLSEKGNFQFATVPVGDYIVCVQVPGGLWLDPCEWEASVPRVNVSDRSKETDLKIVLRLGTAVQVRIEDSGELLSRHDGKTTGAGILLALGGEQDLFRLLPILSTDAKGRTHRMVIPYDKALRLIIQSPFFKISDEIGVPLRDTDATVIPSLLRRAMIFRP